VAAGDFGVRVGLQQPTLNRKTNNDQRDDGTALAHGKGSDADLLREMIARRGAADDTRGGALTGEPCGEKNRNRLMQRNGYRDRDWGTRTGTAELGIHRLRWGS
jgi:hypothetical protein